MAGFSPWRFLDASKWATLLISLKLMYTRVPFARVSEKHPIRCFLQANTVSDAQRFGFERSARCLQGLWDSCLPLAVQVLCKL